MNSKNSIVWRTYTQKISELELLRRAKMGWTLARIKIDWVRCSAHTVLQRSMVIQYQERLYFTSKFYVIFDKVSTAWPASNCWSQQDQNWLPWHHPEPLLKPNNQPLYIHAASNHHPIIKKHLPSMIAKRVPEISYDEEEFKKAIPLYNEAPKYSGYAFSLTFQQEQSKRKSRAKKRNVVWFNPPLQRQHQNQHWQGVF